MKKTVFIFYIVVLMSVLSCSLADFKQIGEICEVTEDCLAGLVCENGVCIPADDGQVVPFGDKDVETDLSTDGDNDIIEEECTPECTDRECGDDGCGGSCGDCQTPPDDVCSNDSMIWEYEAVGECSDGICQYSYSETECVYGCDGGACIVCEPNCSGLECGDDGCGGSCGNCATPPPSQCLNETTVRHYKPNGTCVDGDCRFEITDSECDYRCLDGVCVDCIPDCRNSECGDDGCGGSCGECDDPPSDACTSSTRLRRYTTPGVCNRGDCQYSYEYVECDYRCDYSQDECVECTPNCENRECGDDGCGGTCGLCNRPPEPECDNDTKLRIFETVGVCLSHSCEYGSRLVTCADGCYDSICLNCLPDCDNMDCGYDDCGFSCGGCRNNQFCIDGECRTQNRR